MTRKAKSVEIDDIFCLFFGNFLAQRASFCDTDEQPRCPPFMKLMTSVFVLALHPDSEPRQ